MCEINQVYLKSIKTIQKTLSGQNTTATSPIYPVFQIETEIEVKSKHNTQPNSKPVTITHGHM